VAQVAQRADQAATDDQLEDQVVTDDQLEDQVVTDDQLEDQVVTDDQQEDRVGRGDQREDQAAKGDLLAALPEEVDPGASQVANASADPVEENRSRKSDVPNSIRFSFSR
jgi:hypothetical protein